jgi:mono/diheme cytochrome c family protein
VFVRTAFGHEAAVQVGLLVLALVLCRVRWTWIPAALALGVVTVQVAHLHAWAMAGRATPLTGAVLLHLWAAALWLGALLPLRLVVRGAPLPVAFAAVRRFSARATVLVIVLALTAVFQGFEMFGGVAGLFGATYGWVAMAKALLFAVLLGFAWRNRFVLTPALEGGKAARDLLSRSIARETGVGVLVLGVAAVLTALPPGMHVAPTWPFTFRLSQPFTLAAPLQPATPTSFYRSETGFSAASVADGGKLFAGNCARCHTANLALAAADGDLFWLLTSGTNGMPGFAAALDDDARWHVIDFLRARAAAGRFPLRAPDIQLACTDGSAPMLSDLRGQKLVVRLSAAAGEGCRADDADAVAAYAIATGLAPERLAGAGLDIDAVGRLRAVLPPPQ